MSPTKIKKIITTVCLTIFWINISAHPGYGNRPVEKYSFSIGPMILMIPRYYGASSYRFIPVPNFNFKYKDFFSLSPYKGISFYINEYKPVKFNIGVRYKFWFRSKRSKKFPGINDLKPYVEGYAITSYSLKPIRFSLGLYHSINKSDFGGFLNAGINYFKRINESISIFCGPTLKISDDKHMKTLYRVTKAQSISANIPEYNLSGGIENISFNTGFTYKFNEKWNSHLMFVIKRFLFDAAKSPLIQNNYQLFGTLSISRKF
ncbi:MAG: MipA/OmpV family protein [Legionellales bacterium]|nr:MipA/OmpV family protein [Legionellales bacterium]